MGRSDNEGIGMKANCGKKVGTDLHFTDEERTLMKELVKETIESSLFGRKEKPMAVPQKLKEKMGAFVCLKTYGQLKGCIGHIKGFLPLDETIREMARQAAFHDPRFAPLDAGEWKATEIEISVLTPMQKVENVEDIRVGVHGLYIEKGSDTGLLLPQVAVEYGWDRTTFLEYACMKAGLDKDAWKSKGTNIYVFSADVF
ncbi:MAG TPA: AmmeMemoRadiSam system protein A [Syntrophorhabdales bacterium]|nr:AmmeMemoRadiSam system protein A [Syntrophorhabdales bacterium]